jgi:hypothetical protein
MERIPKRSPLRLLAVAVMAAAGIFILSFALTDNNALNRDYTEYWAVGHQLIHHRNPYDSADILKLLHASGSDATSHMILRNPPTALFMTLPLGFVGVKAGAVLWTLMLVASLVASIRMIWIMQDCPTDGLKLIGYIFPPSLACLLAGQLGAILLLGITSFLYFQSSRPFLAGVALLLCSLKPHLFLPFGLALLIWIVIRKAYHVIFGALTAMTASFAVMLLLDPAIWSQYAHGERGENIQNLFIPCLSVVFRVLIYRNAFWLQFLPAFAGCIWAAWYFWKRRDDWSWTDDAPVLLLVSVLVAPYAWFTDETILVPAILAGLYRARKADRSLLPFGCLAAVALLEVLFNVPLTSGLYLWTAPAWLAWYLFAVRGTDPLRSTEAQPETILVT